MLLKPKCNSDPFKTVEEWMSWKNFVTFITTYCLRVQIFHLGFHILSSELIFFV